MKKIILSSVGIIAVAAIAAGVTYAFFTDTATTQANSFSSGTLSIYNEGIANVTPITIPYMAPGDVSDEYSVIIKNDGNLKLGWLGDWRFIGGEGSNVDLKNALYIADAKMAFLTPTNQNWLNDSTSGYDDGMVDHFIKDGVGNGPYASWFNSVAAAATPFPLVSFNAFNNNSGMIPGSNYEHTGALKPGYSYKLTLKFGFAPAAGNEYQNLGPVTAQLQVNATQINASALENQGVPAASAPGLVTWMNSQISDQTEQ